MTFHPDILCPFCGLGCGDIRIDRDQSGIAPRPSGCPQADRLFRRSMAVPTDARLDGAAIPMDDAIAEAVRLLGSSRAPLIAGLTADVEGVLAALSLAERIGATVDHERSDALFRNMAVLRRFGWSVTTLAELRNRCDLVLVVGPDPAAAFPRLWERWVVPEPAFAGGNGRSVVFLGGEPLPETVRCLGARVETSGLDTGAETDLATLVGRLRTALAGRLAAGDPMAALATRLRSARYAVVVWAAGLFEGPQPDLIVEGLVRLIRTVDGTTRCAGLPLSGADNLIGANQACGWRTGFPLRTGFDGGGPLHDPERFDWHSRLRDADVTLWISAFRPETPPLTTGGSVIMLAPPETIVAPEPVLFIPVGTPGIDHPGDVFRTDGVVALHAGALIDRGLPSVADVIGRMLAAIGQNAETREAAGC
ncbi:formylmethanofuran dehydrogenase [Azospirillum melinis]|uniref:Formylmethanofuran dehydrogenase n=1 Tax=Azospirillum melinis TaxID=328839 RepID=A0ABX2K4M3_9PROT|nr:formylmethanofuran dehydrogenase [Azospirillum melinis]MBP2306439.1 formylmethanofuran dehydrogenase subunit B [Azospirillum melinis]NUA98203.1 formylmethanofuran dehydrogenase [Azospirillum melinis]